MASSILKLIFKKGGGLGSVLTVMYAYQLQTKYEFWSTAKGSQNIVETSYVPRNTLPWHKISIIKACLGGAQALQQDVGAITEGKRADIMVLDHRHPKICSVSISKALDAWSFGHAANAVRCVMVAGQWVVQDGEHISRPSIEQRYRKTVSKLFS